MVLILSSVTLASCVTLGKSLVFEFSPQLKGRSDQVIASFVRLYLERELRTTGTISDFVFV